MADGLNIDTEVLRAHATTFEALANAITRCVDDLTGNLSRYQNAAGTDRVGEQFHGVFDPAAQDLVEGSYSLPTSVARMGLTLRTVASAYEGAEIGGSGGAERPAATPPKG